MTQAASVDGVLGGFGHVSPVDIIGSKSFLRAIPNVKFGASIDCGAGIGRISKGLLAPLFARVDLVEQNPVYVAKAKEYCAGLPSMKSYWVQGLQEFQFEPQAYDCIWIQSERQQRHRRTHSHSGALPERISLPRSLSLTSLALLFVVVCSFCC
jgi:hypothetical protein